MINLVSSFNLRSDFAADLIGSKKQGYTIYKKTKNGIKTTKIYIKSTKNTLNRRKGAYISLEFANIYDFKSRDDISNELSINLKSLLRKYKISSKDKVLIVGLGNRFVTADALGPSTINNVLVTNHLYELDINKSSRVSVVTPGVMAQTGMETLKIIQGIQSKLKAKLVIVIDALATLRVERINRMIQISDTGISPGSGVGNNRLPISKETLHVPTISIGVATVVDLYSMLFKMSNDETFVSLILGNASSYIVTPKDIDEDIKHLADILASAINKTLNKYFKNM